MKLLASILGLCLSETCTCPEGSTTGIITSTTTTSTVSRDSSECPNRSTVTRGGIQCQAWNTNEPQIINPELLPADADTG